MVETKSSKKIHAYTPGLKIKLVTKLTKTRRLPIAGEVFVKEGEQVDFDTIVASTFLIGDPFILKASITLGIEPMEVLSYLTKKIGDPVAKGEIIAHYKALFGLINKKVTSPVDGILESASDSTGQIIVRGAQIPLSLSAYVPGRIIKVIPKEGVIIETVGAIIQGIFGLGGERHGEIKILVDSPEKFIGPEDISEENRGQVIVIGSQMSSDVIKKASKVGIVGIIAGGIEYDELRELLGEEIGVAITGEENLNLTLIITEGFGRMAISKRAFDVLQHFEGYMTSINGTTQIRAGVIRPEIIISHQENISQDISDDDLNAGITSGTLVRIIRNPNFGTIGKVTQLPINLQKIESESKVRVLEVELENGTKLIIPRANVEIIEE